jgi:hypothetical protein
VFQINKSYDGRMALCNAAACHLLFYPLHHRPFLYFILFFIFFLLYFFLFSLPFHIYTKYGLVAITKTRLCHRDDCRAWEQYPQALSKVKRKKYFWLQIGPNRKLHVDNLTYATLLYLYLTTNVKSSAVIHVFSVPRPTVSSYSPWWHICLFLQLFFFFFFFFSLMLLLFTAI